MEVSPFVLAGDFPPPYYSIKITMVATRVSDQLLRLFHGNEMMG